MARNGENGMSGENPGNGRGQRRTFSESVPTQPTRSFRADLADLVEDSGIITGRTSSQIDKLDEINREFDDFLVENLVKRFKMTDADARALGDMDARIKYIEENSWKLKIPEFAPMMDAATGLQNEMRKKEEDIRAEIDEILMQQEKITEKNEELLKTYHEQLMEDVIKAENLEIENAGLLDTIPDITTSPLYQEVENLKGTIERKYNDIDDIRGKIEDKENDNITLSNEIDELDDKIRGEMAEIAKLNREKIELDKEIMNLNKELGILKKTGTPEQISDLEARIRDKNEERSKKNDKINDRNNIVNSHRDEKSKKIGKRNENLRTINTLSNEKRELRASIEQNEKDHRIKLAELTKEREEDSEEVRKFKRNLKELELLDIDNRKDLYEEKRKANSKFKKELDENRQEINKKFRDYKKTPPTKVAPGAAAAAVAAGSVGEGANSAPATGGTPAAGGGAQAVGSAPAGNAALVPIDLYDNLTDKQLANNFYNDVVNKHYSPYEMQLRLSGYGFSTFVNACEHLSARQRRKILPILKERRVRLGSTPADELAFQRVFGDDIYKLVYDSSTRAPRNLSDLSEEEIRSLSIAAEEFNKNLVMYSDDDIKTIESKFFDVLANSAVVDMYESSSTLKGRITGWIDNLRNRQKVQVVKELRGSMCQYHRDKVDRFATTDSRERKFKDILGRDTVRDPVKSQRTSNVPDLARGNSALRQEAEDRITRS